MPRAIVLVNGNALGQVDCPINTLVQLGNDGLGDETTYTWSITDQPPGTADVLSTTNGASPTFTPKKEGSYLILLIVDQGLPTERRDTNVVGIRQLKTRTRIPAAGEQSEAGPQRGHAQDANEMLQLLDTMRADPLLCVAQASGNLTRNNVVRFTGMATIKAGLPGEELVPVVSLASASNTSTLTEQLGVVEGRVDRLSDSVSNGDLVLVRLGGVQQAGGVTGSPGASVFVSDAGLLSLTAGTNSRLMGALLSASSVLLGFGNSAGGLSLSSATPAAVAAAGAPGTGLTVSRADHVHAHGNQAGGTLHDLVTTSVPGFMSAEDKVKLDGISAGATPVGLGNAVPQAIAANGAPGTATNASREDHVHPHGAQAGGNTHELVNTTIAGFMSPSDKVKLDGVSPGATNTPLSTSTPSPIAAIGGVGSASTAARGDHVHAHGDQGGGTQHTVATPALAGFMSAADKAKLDGINPDISGALGLSSAIPSAVAAASAVGVDTGAARGDHVHAHGNQAGGTTHAVVTPTVNGFMSASDKSKLDGIAPNATALQLASTLPLQDGTAAAGTGSTAARADHVHPHNLSSTAPAAVGVTAIGTALTSARSDHVHAHGNQGGGSLHAIATTAVAGFMSATDKAKLDTIDTSIFARLAGGNTFTGAQVVVGNVTVLGAIQATLNVTAYSLDTGYAGDFGGDIASSNQIIAQYNIRSDLGDIFVTAGKIFTGSSAPAGVGAGDIGANGDIIATGDLIGFTHKYSSAVTFNRMIDTHSAPNNVVWTLGATGVWTAGSASPYQMRFNLNKTLKQGASWTRIRVRVKPSTARSGTSRMSAAVATTNADGTQIAFSTAQYDDGSTNPQYITLTIANSGLPGSYDLTSANYSLMVGSGSGGSAGDEIRSADVQFTTSYAAEPN